MERLFTKYPVPTLPTGLEAAWQLADYLRIGYWIVYYLAQEGGNLMLLLGLD